MEYRVGRLIDHVHLRVRDLAASRLFYSAALDALGKGETIREGEGYFSADELWVDQDAGNVSQVHLAFQTTGPDQVAAFHEAALAAGGRDNGGPGERPYHAGYYAAYVLDPDGNNVEAVFHGPSVRSADAVVITPVG
jgi:catechol 2,3-dioxygenase-like lactoylglutathione lyase family enzyme